MSRTRITAPRIAWIPIEPCDICGLTTQVCAVPPGVLQADPCENCSHPPACHAWA